ncbi:ATP-grasp domain-containing protein [Allochromatium palmeri]|uniref:Carbamoyl-phosphate-synthetase n=1 Tax=Allochromatium palmeri TaxID=231048 RepID=A0A6N8EGQ9_9GAMM|nr:ATP-grasp domain-containing protein [Allochromatium palmeri]MTW21554.1 carbamoyl-phosphate-synthetase [Allochromatium palmeri]
MIARIGASPWSQWNLAVTGINASPENPGPGCAVARCLSEASGFRGRVLGLGYETLDAGLYQPDDCAGGYLLPYPASGSQALLERLDDILSCERIDAIIPSLDAELPNFIDLEPTLARRGVRMLLPSRAQLRRRDKDRLPALCAQAGVATPRVRPISDLRFFERCTKPEEGGWTWPLVVKGVFYDAFVVHDPEEAAERFRQIADAWGYPVLVQEHVAGEEVNLTALGDGSGALIGPVMMRKQAVTDKGKAWAGVAIDDSDLLAAGERLMRTLAWRGPLELELLRDAAGTLHLIEINPRFPAWVYLSHGVGRNLPVALLALLHGTAAANLPLAEPRPGVTFIRHARDLIVEMDDLVSVTMTGATRRQSAEPRHRLIA